MKCSRCGLEISHYADICACGHQQGHDNWGVIQIETTGLDAGKGHEILQLVILNRFGVPVYCQLYQPVLQKSWAEAERKNHISPEMVRDKPHLTEKEAENVSRILGQYSRIITNSVSFVMPFLDAAKIKYPDIQGIYGLFYHYQEDHGMILANSLSVCAEYFGYDKTGINEQIEKAYKIWFCYQHIAVLQQDKILDVMGESYTISGITYQVFVNEWQMADYLKLLGICPIQEQDIPQLYYDGRFTAEPTMDVYPLGIEFDEDKQPKRLVLCVKEKIVAVPVEEFIEMQHRMPARQEENGGMISGF